MHTIRPLDGIFRNGRKGWNEFKGLITSHILYHVILVVSTHSLKSRKFSTKCDQPIIGSAPPAPLGQPPLQPISSVRVSGFRPNHIKKNMLLKMTPGGLSRTLDNILQYSPCNVRTIFRLGSNQV